MMKLLFRNIILTILLNLFLITNAFADVNQSLSSGAQWLLSRQKADGSFGLNPETIPLDTVEAIYALRTQPNTNLQVSNAINFLNSYVPSNYDYIGRISGAINNSSYVQYLVENKNEDSGWGISAGFNTNPLDTALALQALKAVNYSDQTIINNAISYILSTQNPDGGFGFYQGDASNVYMTAVVSSTLQQFSRTTLIATAINKATSYLISKQQADGGWVTIYETAWAYIALVGATTDNTVIGNAINYLTTTQFPNGSWNDDPYSTALALRALYLSQNKPIPPPPPDKGTVTGSVVDASTNQPLGGVFIVLESDSAINTLTGVTGSFTLSNISTGSQKINFVLSGYTTTTATVNITAGSIINLGIISLSTSATAGAIKGTITDAANGQPLSGVTITVTGSFNGNTVTGIDGSFIFTNVTPGNVTITASKTGYYPVTSTGTIAAGGILFFNPRISTQPPTQTTGNLTGKVFDSSTNKPIQGSIVSISGVPSGIADSQGVFLIKDIAPNTYQVTISAAGYTSQIYQVMIMAGATTDMQTINLMASLLSTTITGKVSDAVTGNPIAGAEVAVVGTNVSVKTDSAGSYTISGIKQLEFTLKASAVGYDSVIRRISTTNYGPYTIDFSLNQSSTSNIKLTTLITEEATYNAAKPVKILMKIVNNGNVDVKGTIFLEIIDPKGNVIYADFAINHKQTDQIEALFDFLRGEISVEAFWMSNQYSPGQYSIAATLRNTDDVLLDNKITYFNIAPSKIISGNISTDPFTAQPQQSVNVRAKVRNAGNVPLYNTNLSLSITFQGEIAPLMVVNKTLVYLDVDEEDSFDYGFFIPEKGGDYSLTITAEDTDVQSQL